MVHPAPLLVLGVGNPSRGDDALGPIFVERLGETLSREVSRGALDLLTEYQLQIEHALDLTGRERVFFVDASVRACAPFELTRVAPRRDSSISTHALSPEAVLATHRELLGEPPEAWILAIRAERFELGTQLSDAARGHLQAALQFFVSQALRPTEAAALEALARDARQRPDAPSADARLRPGPPDLASRGRAAG